MKVKQQTGVKKIISFTDFYDHSDFKKWQQDQGYEIVRFDTVTVEDIYSGPAAGSDGYGPNVSLSKMIAITRVYYYIKVPVYKEVDVKDGFSISNTYQNFDDRFTIGARYGVIDKFGNEYFGEFQDEETFITSQGPCDIVILKEFIKYIKTI